MSLLETAHQNLGELIVMGFQGFELSDETCAFISQARIGGVILFGSNYESPGQLAELSNQIQACRTDLPLWVGVDHEGGRIQRFKKPFTKLPDAVTIGAHGSPKTAFELAEVIGRELRAVGINLNFSPVADITTNPKNPVIGARAYGSTERLVTSMVTAMVRGHLTQGVQPCVKHFPGHGDTTTDSQYALPKVDTPIETLREREFKPFARAFRSGCAMVMTAHILLPKVDPVRPATLSPKVLQEWLRGELRYTGLIVSDDLEAKAITDHFSPEDAPRMAINAGCDVLMYRSEAGARRAYASLRRALDEGRLAPEKINLAADRARELKRAALLPYRPIVVAELGQRIGTPEAAALVQKFSEA